MKCSFKWYVLGSLRSSTHSSEPSTVFALFLNFLCHFSRYERKLRQMEIWLSSGNFGSACSQFSFATGMWCFRWASWCHRYIVIDLVGCVSTISISELRFWLDHGAASYIFSTRTQWNDLVHLACWICHWKEGPNPLLQNVNKHF